MTQEETMICDENGKPIPRTKWFDMELYREKLKQLETADKKQCLCRVYYPQNYNVSAVGNSRRELTDLLEKGWVVDRVTQNNEYFADYILSLVRTSTI